MRILQVVQKPQRRGPEILSQRLDKAFRDRGHAATTVFLYSYSGDAPLQPAEEDLPLAGKEDHPLETTLGFHPGLLIRLRREIERFRPDVVQVNGSRSVKYGALAALSSPGRDWKLIYRNIDNPDYWVRDPVRQAYYRYVVMPRMDGVIGVSRGMLRVLERRYGFRVPVIWIPYVVDPSRLRPILDRRAAREHLGLDSEAPIVLFVGALSEQKRPDRFLRVLDRVRREDPRVRGWVIGDGPLRSRVEGLVEELGLGDITVLWGYRSDVAVFMAAADLLLITSDSDGIPTVVQEAGFLHTPVVATRVGGMEECVLHNKTGLLAEADDESRQADNVLRLLNDPQLRDEMGKAARDLVESRFTIDTAVESHLEFFARLRSDAEDQRP